MRLAMAAGTLGCMAEPKDAREVFWADARPLDAKAAKLAGAEAGGIGEFVDGNLAVILSEPRERAIHGIGSGRIAEERFDLRNEILRGGSFVECGVKAARGFRVDDGFQDEVRIEKFRGGGNPQSACGHAGAKTHAEGGVARGDDGGLRARHGADDAEGGRANAGGRGFEEDVHAAVGKDAEDRLARLAAMSPEAFDNVGEARRRNEFFVAEHRGLRILLRRSAVGKGSFVRQSA